MIRTQILIETDNLGKCYFCAKLINGWDSLQIILLSNPINSLNMACCPNCYGKVHSYINTLIKEI